MFSTAADHLGEVKTQDKILLILWYMIVDKLHFPQEFD